MKLLIVKIIKLIINTSAGVNKKSNKQIKIILQKMPLFKL
jgi:hypothetical protein